MESAGIVCVVINSPPVQNLVNILQYTLYYNKVPVFFFNIISILLDSYGIMEYPCI